MEGIYCRMTSLKTISGRSKYINDKIKQEEIVLSKSNQKYDWKFYECYEKENKRSNIENNSGREYIVQLPNELYYEKEKLENICNDFTQELIGTNRDYEYAVHWNKERTNLHMHLIFSERELNDVSNAKPKIYKRDIYYDSTTNRMCKQDNPNAELKAKKGDVQKDKEGNIKLDIEPLTKKDTSFKEQKNLYIAREKIQAVLKKYNYNIDLNDNNSPYLPQKKQYKGATKEYIANVKEYNKNVKEHISFEPDQKNNYLEIKKEMIAGIKDFNSQTKKLNPKVFDFIKEMSDWVKQTITTLKDYYLKKNVETDIKEKFQEVKETFKELFTEKKSINEQLEKTYNDLNNVEFLENKIDDVIENKQEQINSLTPQKQTVIVKDEGLSL